MIWAARIQAIGDGGVTKGGMCPRRQILGGDSKKTRPQANYLTYTQKFSPQHFLLYSVSLPQK